MRTRTWLLYIVLAVLIPALIVSAAGVVFVYREEQAAFQKSMQETARALASLLDKEMVNRVAVLNTLAASPALDTADFQAFQKHARAISTNWNTTIFLSDPNGQQFLNTRMPRGAGNLPKSENLMGLRRIAGPDATVVSDVYMAPIGGAYSVSVQVPVKRDGMLIYYLGMGTFVSQLQSIFATQHLPAEWTGAIVDRQGVIAARSSDAEHFVGRRISDRFASLTANIAQGTYAGTSLQGVDITAFFSRAPLSGWMFVVSVPQSILRSSAIQAAIVLSLLWLAFATAAIYGALRLARRTSKPVEALRNAAEQLRHGMPVPHLHSGIMEIDAVSDEMRRASKQLLRSKAELEEQVADAVAAAARSQRALLQAQKLEALGRLTGGIAHDFNNVLQALNTGLHVIRLSPVADDARAIKALDACQRAVKRAGELTGQLAVFGRTQDARLEVCALDEQLRTIRPLLDSAIGDDIKLHISIGEKLWLVKIDALQFELAILNLAINARDAMPQGGSLSITAQNVFVASDREDLDAGEYVRLDITDTGTGMDAEALAKALEPFYSTKPVGTGSGMGLPQAYGFARQAGGVLTLESKPGAGTRVVLYLARTDAPRAPMVPKTATIAANHGGKRLLLVEDDMLVRDVVAPALSSAGFLVKTADNGDEAYEILQGGQQFDIVFSDVVMPGKLSGVDLAERIAAQFPMVHVVLASGYSDRLSSTVKARILPKPYDLPVLIAVLNGEPVAARPEPVGAA